VSVPKLIDAVPSHLTWREKIAYLVRSFGADPQVDCPLKHHFAPGVYIREIFMPAGAVVIGKIHKTEHFNIIQQGRVRIFDPEGALELAGPVTFVSKPGVQKVLYIAEDTVWSTVHLTDERDLEKLEAALIEPDDAYPALDRTFERLAIARAAA